jgi:hypothetical protein
VPSAYVFFAYRPVSAVLRGWLGGMPFGMHGVVGSRCCWCFAMSKQFECLMVPVVLPSVVLELSSVISHMVPPCCLSMFFPIDVRPEI